ncbi:flagellar type III secretion system protein FlhB [Nocardioides sp. MAH-18]|uniref:Flagellar type III secretion system protein FlhB n=1 Tax=Nocardioides agri TaxID=2682843 RepID=A0A6L6XV41_9ACTN|nr:MULTISPECIES: EscU/YscU/HrcU family type III secretion system export apparatus switch protein [unclassified Nocardioides]MBA2955763.1 EscU/YscU/HrcU family type III secretion system export apparatus switch protein [Nocardioides sp. CGMCC 1.13656]MVQ50613.1 flagellar type III secretion system protein FlhB [Nocardioides sp. MAH-18]
MSGEKTEKPTAKKNRENRKEGKVPRTQELGAWSALALFAMSVPKLVGHEIVALRDLMAQCFVVSGSADLAKALDLLGEGLWHFLVATLLLGCGVMLVGVAGAIAQGGFFIASKAVKPKLSKLNPLQGIKRLFSMKTLWEGGKMLAKSAVVAVLAWVAIKSVLPLVGGLVPMQAVLDNTAATALSLLRNVAVFGLVMAAADYLVQRRQVGKQTKMTKEEVKQEHKNSEGDPQLKGAIRSRQLAAARNRMMADVPTADVVLVNPTHVAVALRYDPERGAPRVVARGAGVIAASIREKAGDAQVPLVRDVPLARSLYSSCQVGQEIPAELFAAVAQVLAFVISRRTNGHRGGEHGTPRPNAPLPEVPKTPRRRREPSGAAPAGR